MKVPPVRPSSQPRITCSGATQSVPATPVPSTSWSGRDFTQGYGPEEYLVRKAPPEMYRMAAAPHTWRTLQVVAY